VAASTSVVVAGVALAAFDLSSAVRDQVSDSETVADIVGLNSAAAVTFGDRKAAGETLSLRSSFKAKASAPS
jgi:hypothetical protein